MNEACWKHGRDWNRTEATLPVRSCSGFGSRMALSSPVGWSQENVAGAAIFLGIVTPWLWELESKWKEKDMEKWRDFLCA